MSAGRRLVVLAGVAISLAAGIAEADCTISTTSLLFGNYDVFSPTPLDSTAGVSYRCAPPRIPVQVMLGRGGSSTFAPRRLTGPTDPLLYNLYLDAARITVWGDGSGGTSIHASTPPSARLTTVTIYGRIPAGQDVRTGIYTDTITATILY